MEDLGTIVLTNDLVAVLGKPKNVRLPSTGW